MQRWVCGAIATALWPITFTLCVAGLSPLMFNLYESGEIARSPVALITLISTGALVISVGICLALWAALCKWGTRDVSARAHDHLREE